MYKMSRNEDTDEEYEILNLSEIDRTWLQRTFTHVTKASAAKQIAVGGVSGWCAGYVFAKVGKLAATALGGSLLLLQVAHYKGVITINWKKLEKDYDNAKKQITKNARKLDKFAPGYVENVTEFASQNVLLAGGFTGGFLLGLASS
ncbi:unnamed protein product [Owenia fusiformis]|uniref:Uncharacterized protein n=1 Tax=Owenia fusiformis TaxID=6347 RepID=A0A8J1XLC0_OWEFU|nr:unnamed protein product [Owenia fusiformis]